MPPPTVVLCLGNLETWCQTKLSISWTSRLLSVLHCSLCSAKYPWWSLRVPIIMTVLCNHHHTFPIAFDKMVPMPSPHPLFHFSKYLALQHNHLIAELSWAELWPIVFQIKLIVLCIPHISHQAVLSENQDIIQTKLPYEEFGVRATIFMYVL